MVVCLISLLALELSFRIMVNSRRRSGLLRCPENWLSKKSKMSAFMSHPYISFVKKPKNTMARYISNNLGYTGSKDIYSKDENEIRLFVLGCSTTEQNDYEREGDFDPDVTWPRILENNLVKINENLTVINAAAGGYTSVESLIEFQLRGLYLKPDYIIYYHGINDVWLAQAIAGFKTDYTHSRRVPVFPKPPIIPDISWFFIFQYFKYKLGPKRDHMIESLMKSCPFETDLSDMDSKVAVFKNNVRSTCAIALANGIKPILVTMVYPDFLDEKFIFYGHMFDKQAKMQFKKLFELNNQAIREVCQEFEGAILIEPKGFDHTHFRDFDWVHWSKKGMIKFAGVLSERISLLINERNLSKSQRLK